MKRLEKIFDTLPDNIVFTGYLYGDDYEALLFHAALCVSSSLLEGTSPSLLAAMSINGFVFVSDLPENKEVLKDTCRTFRCGDKEDLSAGIRMLANNDSLVESGKAQTREVVRNFYNWDRTTTQYEQLIYLRHESR